MNNRERMQALLRGERVEPTPMWVMGFTGEELARRLIPEDLIPPFFFAAPEMGAYDFDSVGEEAIDRQIRLNDYLNRCLFAVGKGAAFSQGHRGPGEYQKAVIARDEDACVLRSEVGGERGGLTTVRARPHFSHTDRLPVTAEDDLESLQMPALDAARFAGFARDAAYAKSKGQFTIGWTNGFFSACHYHFMDYQTFLETLLVEPDFAKRLIALSGAWTLDAARRLCEAGADAIGFCDDLGSTASMLISPATYREFIFPWHKKLCTLAHSYHAVVYMHSHGAIMPILGDLRDAGIDILNPLDPDDHMNLEEARAAAGKRMVLMGGTDKHFFDWTPDAQYDRLKDLLRRARDAGPFILGDSAGIPTNVAKERFDLFLGMCRELL
jgi:uroporphyrinogen-III decarboxylase